MSKSTSVKDITMKEEHKLVEDETSEDGEAFIMDTKQDTDNLDSNDQGGDSSPTEIDLKTSLTFSCDFCYKTYLNKSALGKHLQSHGIKQVTRKKGGSRQLVSPQRSIVKILRNQKPEKEKISNEHCQVMCSGKSTLRRSSSNFLENSRLACGLCPKSFGSRADLTWHTRTHCETTFVCEHCSMGFSSKPELLKHIRVHSGKKPWLYFCEHCHKGFSDKSSLIEHKRNHTPYSMGEKPIAPKVLPKPLLVTQMRMKLKQLFHSN